MDTDEVMLAHIQSRINGIQRGLMRPNGPDLPPNQIQSARLDELNLMFNVLSAANRLAMLANQVGPTHGCTDCGEPGGKDE